MNDDILDFYTDQGLEVKLVKKITSSSSSTDFFYKYEFYSVGNNILFAKYIGQQIRGVRPNESLDVSLFDIARDFLESHQNTQLIQNFEEFSYVSVYGKKEYLDWLEHVADRFDSIVFYKGATLMNIFIASAKLFNKKFNNIKIINSFHEFQEFHHSSQKYGRKVHESEVLSLLKESLTNPIKKWTHDINNGRLTQETKLIDENIIISKLKGETISRDATVVGLSKKIMRAHIPNHHDKFFLLFDIKNLKNQSVKQRLETYDFFESIIEDVHAIIICNASAQAIVSAKAIIATKASLKNKIFFKESLKDSIVKALQMKGVEVIRDNNGLVKENLKKPKWYECLFSRKKTRRIYELELEIESLKRERKQHHHNTMLMIGRILWGKPFAQIPESNIQDEKSREIYSVIEILHKELKDLASISEKDRVKKKEL